MEVATAGVAVVWCSGHQASQLCCRHEFECELDIWSWADQVFRLSWVYEQVPNLLETLFVELDLVSSF
ncbi:hypothetical protein JTE90_027648 [Oedothorax gibbosus]|uniref:Uncharacterized protein n=1 Tax=Oedothorax gibbosus TaxID=931172 RepID=A0AAV6USN2_9ARAC|nr:hypothetical protein JTE90_027648 [Oedothorax gibbosus]